MKYVALIFQNCQVCTYDGCNYKTARISCFNEHVKRHHTKWKGGEKWPKFRYLDSFSVKKPFTSRLQMSRGRLRLSRSQADINRRAHQQGPQKGAGTVVLTLTGSKNSRLQIIFLPDQALSVRVSRVRILCLHQVQAGRTRKVCPRQGQELPLRKVRTQGKVQARPRRAREDGPPKG